eukprot:scaffold92707_cov16-Tisochrysis_lutea.AAC.1
MRMPSGGDKACNLQPVRADHSRTQAAFAEATGVQKERKEKIAPAMKPRALNRCNRCQRETNSGWYGDVHREGRVGLPANNRSALQVQAELKELQAAVGAAQKQEAEAHAALVQQQARAEAELQ